MISDYTNAILPPLTDIPLASAGNLFPNLRSENGFGESSGLRTVRAFTAAELTRISELIKEHLLNMVSNQPAELRNNLEVLPLERWHEASSSYDHGALLSKRNRVLSAAATREVLSMSPFDHLREVFEDFYLYDEDNFGQEEISFRIVRPERREDVGSLHRDDWFWQSHSLRRPKGMHRVKLWVQITGDPETAGLRLAPNSHRLNVNFEPMEQGTKLIFKSDVDWRKINLRRFTAPLGTPILFNHYTLHVGSLNPGPLSRVSFETTLIFS